MIVQFIEKNRVNTWWDNPWQDELWQDDTECCTYVACIEGLLHFSAVYASFTNFPASKPLFGIYI